MVKYLLDAGANVKERCYGAFMSPEDQKASRSDCEEHEWVDVNHMTNYDGYVYWGEYPLSFAACLGQEECYRLVLARGADPDAQDLNGNTVLHMMVIYEKLETFDMAYEVGSTLGIRNVLHLTPLTLAAKLGRVEMFCHIMNIEREIYWQLGSITCAAYPLSQIDTIDVETGNISKDSALNLVVFGDKDEHLELMDGVLIDLLKTKWNTFVKSRFYRQFYLFSTYFLVSLVSFLLRPGPDKENDDDDINDDKISAGGSGGLGGGITSNSNVGSGGGGGVGRNISGGGSGGSNRTIITNNGISIATTNIVGNASSVVVGNKINKSDIEFDQQLFMKKLNVTDVKMLTKIELMLMLSGNNLTMESFIKTDGMYINVFKLCIHAHSIIFLHGRHTFQRKPCFEIHEIHLKT